MRKKLVSMIAALALVFSLVPMVALADSADVAQIDNTGYATLAAAISAAAAGDTVKLLTDIGTEGTDTAVTIASGKKITLDLNGCTIYGYVVNNGTLIIKDGTAAGEYMTGDGGIISATTHTVQNSGTLTIESGYFDALTHGKAALYNNTGATITEISGGYFTRSEETGNSDNILNSYYVVLNDHGTIDMISGGFFGFDADCSTYNRSSLFDNYGTIDLISGGTFINGFAVMKVEEGCTIDEITGGTFSSTGGESALLNYGTVTISGGTFTATGTSILGEETGIAVFNSTWKDYAATTIITGGTFIGVDALRSDGEINTLTTGVTNRFIISGGDFTGAFLINNKRNEDTESTASHSIVITGGSFTTGDSFWEGRQLAEFLDSASDISISSGYFTAYPADYLADGYVTVPSDEAGYTYMVVAKSADAADVVTGSSAASVNEDLTGVALAAAEDLAEEITATGIEVDTYIVILANAAAQDNTLLGTAQAVKDEYIALDTTIAGLTAVSLEAPSSDYSNVTIVYEPYIDVVIEDIDIRAGGNALLTLDISAYYNVLATTDPDSIVKYDEAWADTPPSTAVTVNAVTVAEGVPMTVSASVDLVIPITAGIYDAFTGNTLLIKHEKTSPAATYNYPATVNDDNGSYTLEFTSLHGFSIFTLSVDNRSAVVQFYEDAEGTTTLNSEVTYIPSNIGATLPTVEAPSGYTFKGWKFTLNGENITDATGTYATLTDALLLALSIAYNDTTTANPGSNPIHAVPVIEETTVIGSSSSSSSSSSSGGGSSTTTYTVKFDANGGSTVSSQSVAKNNTVTKPADPTYSGYSFTGWYTDAKLTEEYDFSAKVTGAFTLYAGWEKIAASEPGDAITHSAYLSGYSDGTFRPDHSLTRAEAATLFYNLLGGNSGSGGAYPDVASGAWYCNAVTALSGVGVITGYPNGTFGPDNTITRAEFVAMAMRFAGVSGKTGSIGFPDVASTHWAAGYIAAAADGGYLSGYPDGTFGPDNQITRAEAVTILNNLRGCAGLDQGKTFSDVPASHWAYEAITAAATDHTHE